MSLYQALAARWTVPARPALHAEDRTVSYAELEQRVARAAGWLAAHGVEEGDVVALQLGKTLAFVELHLAALALGAATLPLNPTYTDREVAYYLRDSKAKLAVLPAPAAAALGRTSAAGLRGALDAASPVPLPARLPPETPAVLCYTSGTTGEPKGAVITQRNLLATVVALHSAWRWGPGDHLLHVLPLFHIHGLFVAQHGALYAGATTTWMPRFDAEGALRLLEEERCSVFMGVPTHYARLLALPASVTADLSAMRLFTSGSAPLPARSHEAFSARFGHRILERYGMTEVGIVLSNPADGERRPGAVGFSVPNAQLEIRDPEIGQPVAPGSVGELFHKGPSVIAAYLGRPEQTAATIQDGWLRSGDLGYRDPDGYVHLVGRSKDLILSGGMNVYPPEVEAVLLELDAVQHAAVVGIPDDDFGERVVAAVVLHAGAALDPAAAVAHARAHLAPYKCPKAVRVVDALPRNAMGKVQKARIRAGW